MTASSPPGAQCWHADLIAALVDGMNADLDTCLHVRVDTATRLEVPKLRRALLRLVSVIPELGCHFQQKWWRSRWVRAPEPEWTLEEAHGVTVEAAAAAEADLFAQPFAPLGKLPLRLRLLHMADHDRLLLRIEHLLADGGGAKNLCYALAAAYRGLSQDPHWQPAQPLRRAPLGRAWACLGRVPVLPLLASVPEEVLANLPSAPLRAEMLPEGGGGNRCAHLHLPAERVARLQAAHRRRGVTLNDVAVAAFTRALEQAFPRANAGRSHAMLMSTADLRLREEQPGDDVGNFSTLRPLVISRLPCAPPQEHLARVVVATRRWKRGGVGVGAATLALFMVRCWPHALLRLFFRVFFAVVRWRTRGITAFTNIGPFQAERLDFGAGPCLAAHVMAPVARTPMLLTALTGCRGALDFTVAYPEHAMAPGSADLLLSALDRELAALESGHGE